MKKILILVTALLLSIGASAQTDLHYLPVTFSTNGTSTVGKVFTALTLPTENTVTYVEVLKTVQDPDYYIQFFHEQKFWEAPIYMHAEFRDQSWSGYGETMLMVGGAFDVFTKNGMIAFEPLLRIDGEKRDWGHFQPMFSIVTGHDWGKFNLSSFSDFWYDSNYLNNGFNWYSEAWAYFKVWEHFQLGAVLSASYNESVKFSASVAPGLKIIF